MAVFWQGHAENDEYPRFYPLCSNVPESATFTIIVIFWLRTRLRFLVDLSSQFSIYGAFARSQLPYHDLLEREL